MSTTSTMSGLIRTDLWSIETQDELQEQLFAQTIVDLVTDFPDGNTLNIPTFSSLAARDYTENTDIVFDDPTIGEFELTVSEYLGQGTYITDKFRDDAFYVAQVQAKYPQMLVRGFMERFENDVMLLHKKQTTNDPNTINGVAHRYVGTGTSNVIALADVAKAKLALDKANVSKVGRKAIVDPSVSYQLIQLDNVIRQDVYGANSNFKAGFGSTNYIGMYMGFEFYESNMLDEATALDHATGGALKGNLFIGDEAFKGVIRTMPSIEYYRNVSKKRDEYSATMRYGLGLYRAPALVTVLTA